MKPKKISLRLSLSVFGLCVVFTFLAPLVAIAKEFPSKPIKLIIPMPPGGSHDAHARAFCGVAHQYFGVPVLGVIKAGGGGSIGASYVAKVKADGYTMILGDQQTMLTKPLVEKLPYTYKDFVSIGRINYSPMLVCVHADAPYKNLKELVAYAREHPNGVVWGMGAGAGVGQLTMAPFIKKTGVQFKAIPYTGGGPQLMAFLKKDNDLGAFFPSVVAEHIKKGTVRAIAVGSPERLEQFPDIPTLIEEGYDHQFAMFRAIFVRKAVPESRVKKLREYFDQTVKDKSFQSIVKRMGERVIYMSGDKFDKFMDEENERMKVAVKIIMGK